MVPAHIQSLDGVRDSVRSVIHGRLIRSALWTLCDRASLDRFGRLDVSRIFAERLFIALGGVID
jgi:hypothetical protein